MEKKIDIQVGPYIYQLVRSKQKLRDNEIHSDSTMLYGLTVHDRQKIYVDETVGKDIRQDTELHELLHCCFFAAGITTANEEEIVRPLATILLDTMRRNKEFFYELMGSPNADV